MAPSYDLLVIGAGPAGMMAAIAARRNGMSVAVIDEARAAGGQIYRAPSYAPAEELTRNPELRRGEELRAGLERSGADLFFGHRVWFLAPGGRASAVAPGGPVDFEGGAVVVATGTTERVVPVPGITLPGVIGLAAATVLLKAHAALPTAPTVVAGVGPLLYAVANGLLKGGGEVAAVVDLARSTEWLAAVPGLASRPDLLGRGLSWQLKLRRAGVPVFSGHAVTAIHGATAPEEAEIRPVDREWQPRPEAPPVRFKARSVAIGHGLVPATEALRVLGVPQVFRADLGGWVPRLAPEGRADLPGVYAAGDCAGVRGAAAAELAGELAGLAAARHAGRIPKDRHESEARPLRQRLARAERFGAAITRLMTLRPGLVRGIPDATVVCRCEDVTRAAIDGIATAGARRLNQLKSTIRCGMGPCQGRMCGEPAAELLALASGGDRISVGQWTARAPIRPLPLAAAVGHYTYDDIPKPTPAPA